MLNLEVLATIGYIFLNLKHTVVYSSCFGLLLFLDVYCCISQCYFELKGNLNFDISEMGNNNGVTKEITNAKLFQAILDLQKNLQKNTENLQKNTESVSQIANNLEDIKQQQDEIKRDFL